MRDSFNACKETHMKSVLLVLTVYFFAFSSVHAQHDLTVTKVADGEILALNDGRKVRLIGAACPKLKDKEHNLREAKKLGLDPFAYEKQAPKAKKFLEQLVAGQKIRTHIDPINEIIHHHDRYMRFLAYVFAGDVLVNGALIKQGYCAVDTEFDFRYKKMFMAYAREAKKERKGMWAQPSSFVDAEAIGSKQEMIAEHGEQARRAYE